MFRVLILSGILYISGCASGKRSANDFLRGFETGYMSSCIYHKPKVLCEAEVNRLLKDFR